MKKEITVVELWKTMVTKHNINKEEADWLKENCYKQLTNQLYLNNIPVTTVKGMKGWANAVVHFRSESEFIKFVDIAKSLNN